MQSVIITSFGEAVLCPVACLRAYEAATEKFTISVDRMQLFLVTIVPHGPVTSSTISRWLKKTLQEAKLGQQFTGHSTRSAASTQEIMKRAGWSRESTFCQFYCKPSEKLRLPQCRGLLRLYWLILQTSRGHVDQAGALEIQLGNG